MKNPTASVGSERIRSPDRPSRSSVAIPTELPGPLSKKYICNLRSILELRIYSYSEKILFVQLAIILNANALFSATRYVFVSVALVGNGNGLIKLTR
jgi:hypothetical protein